MYVSKLWKYILLRFLFYSLILITAFYFVSSLIDVLSTLILLCFSFLSFKTSFSPFRKTQRTLDGLYPRVAQMKSLALHLVPFLLLSLCTLTIGVFIQLLRRFGLTICMEETVSRAAYTEAVLQKGTKPVQTISRSICLFYKHIYYLHLPCSKDTPQRSHFWCHFWFNEDVGNLTYYSIDDYFLDFDSCLSLIYIDSIVAAGNRSLLSHDWVSSEGQ